MQTALGHMRHVQGVLLSTPIELPNFYRQLLAKDQEGLAILVRGSDWLNNTLRAPTSSPTRV